MAVSESLTSWFNDVVDWGAAILRHIVVFLIGPFLGGAVFLWEHFRREGISIGLIAFLVFFSTVVAFFRAWRDEHRKAIALSEKLENPAANLQAKIVSVISGGKIPGRGRVLVQVTASIGNRPPSIPSIAENYGLTITDDTHTVAATLEHVGGTITMGDIRGQSITYSSKDLLYNKTMPAPIPVGGRETGILVFTIPESERAILDQGRIHLSFVDIIGEPHSAHAVLGDRDNSDDVAFIPGTTPLSAIRASDERR